MLRLVLRLILWIILMNGSPEDTSAIGHTDKITRYSDIKNNSKNYYNFTESTDINFYAQECKLTIKGTEYAGKIATSADGKQCEKWSDHRSWVFWIDINDDKFPDISVEAAENYCRNPDGRDRGPWCFAGQDWGDQCDISFCDGVINVTECRQEPNGFKYSGKLSYSMYEEECVRWDQLAFRRFYNYEFPDSNKTSANNYCRNPSNIHTMPACYTNQTNEHSLTPCLISMCSEPVAGVHPECRMTRRGWECQGKMAKTINGDVCELWRYVDEEYYYIERENLPDENIDEALNYCRNPTNDSRGPWCYYKSDEKNQFEMPKIKKRYCSIPVCGVPASQHHSKMNTFSRYASKIVILIICPICLLFGTASNIMSIAVMMRKSLRESTTATLIVCLSVFDLLSLYMGAFPRWLRSLTNIYLETSSNISCQVYAYFRGVIMTFPAWLLLALTGERYISLARPFEAKIISTRKNACKCLSGIFAVICIINTPKGFYSTAW